MEEGGVRDDLIEARLTIDRAIRDFPGEAQLIADYIIHCTSAQSIHNLYPT